LRPDQWRRIVSVPLPLAARIFFMRIAATHPRPRSARGKTRRKSTEGLPVMERCGLLEHHYTKIE
jgi:hypothetical protein